MSVVIKYGSTFLLIGGIALAIALLLLSLSDYGGKNLAINYCLGSGIYEERLYKGVLRGYCIFNNIKCNISECPVLKYYSNECKPCDYQVIDCAIYDGVSVCEQNYNPVCARIRTGLNNPFILQEKTYGNACSACINSKETEVVTGYTNNSCDY